MVRRPGRAGSSFPRPGARESGRATPGGAKAGAGYLTIENKGSAADRLVAISGDVAGKIEVHEMAMNNGVMTMRPLDQGLIVDPGKTVTLAPGSSVNSLAENSSSPSTLP